MGKIVDFEKTKAIIMAFEGMMESQVNLGIGDDPDEFALLLGGKRSQMLQIGDDDLYELTTIYNQVMTWVRLGTAGNEPLLYKKLSAVGNLGNGVSATIEAGQIATLQLILQQGDIVIAVEKILLKDIDMLLQWFLLNVISYEN